MPFDKLRANGKFEATFVVSLTNHGPAMRLLVQSRIALTSVAIAVAVLTLAACGSSNDAETDLRAASAAAAQPTTAAPTGTPKAEPPPLIAETRTTGQVEGVTFVIGEGSEATFTVTEQLASLSLPNDAVVRTTALTGEVHLDGRDSTIEINLQRLSSDNSFRDRYIRSTMFGSDPIGVFTVRGLDELPDGFANGEVVSGPVQGELLIRGVTAPLTFEVEARDDGDVIFIVGRTTFKWDDLQIPKPSARTVVSVEDEVRVEVLLSITPKPSSGG